MQYLGYIVSKRKINNDMGFIGVVNNINEIQDTDKPILVVGLNEAKKLTGNFSILEKKINDNLFWTFGKTEMRTDYERDIMRFANYVLEKSIQNIRYHYLDFYKMSVNRVKRFLQFLQSNENKYIYIYNDMLYIYYKNDVFGVSLRILKFSKVKVNKHLNKLKRNKHIYIYNNDYKLNYHFKKLINNKKYVTPYFLSILEWNANKLCTCRSFL